MDNLEKLSAIGSERIKALTAQEMEVFDILLDHLDHLPEKFFEKNTLDQLNEYFEGNDNIVVTENIRLALDAQQKLDFMFEDLADLSNGLAPEEDYDDDESEEIDTRIRTALEKKHYRKAQRLLKPVIYDLEQQMDETEEYNTYREPMEKILYLYHFSPHPDEIFVPYFTAYYYYLLGSAHLELNEIEQARAMMIRAIQLDPVSSEFLLGLAEVCKQEADFVKTFELSKKALTYAYTREDYARCIRNIGYCLIEDEEYEDAAACFRYSQQWKKTEYAANVLREIEEETGWSADESDLPGMSEIAGKYGFTLGLNPDIRMLAEELRSECEEEGDEEQAAYFTSILETMELE